MDGETVNHALECGIRLSHPDKGDEVVITGMAGRFPDSDNVYQLRDNLMNKVDLITDDERRWCHEHPEVPQRTGKINNVSKFDASFFGVHFKQAHTMDPMCRILLESAYEAVVDAGINPRQLRGSRTGVFIGACFSESEKTWFYEKIQVNGFGITGCSRAMLANRVSYWLGANGPSYTVDSACSSSLYALDHAYKAIRDGHCDSALVGGSNLCLHPYVSLQFARLGVLSPGGKCKSFDNSADGYARSEAVCMIYLQKAKDAKRIYSRVVHAKTNCDGYKEQGITYPSGSLQRRLLKEFYEECQIPPQNLAFIEAHGTGTKVGDPEELKALEDTFCNGRDKPLPVGSIKSNLGHSEPASGLCSVTKVCLAFETDTIPPNLHFSVPREGIEALVNGKIKVVSEKTPLEGNLIGVNSFGFGGANCHVLFERFSKKKINNGKPTDGIPRLVVTSGRTEEAVNSILDDLENRSLDHEFVRLLHEVHQDEIPGHVYRGYSVLTQGESGPATRISREAQYFSGAKRPIWFVFSGMGSQWAGMGTALMKIPIFAAAIERCHQALAPKGINITEVITNPDKKTFDNILNSFIGIAAIQIGLVDVLHAIGIVPDNIIGHSVGELGCAYADGCFTAEQMILSAYSRGLASIETKLIRGSMAAIGLGYKEIKDMCPSEIEVACHNGPDSSTISGPAEIMKQFVAELTAKEIFAREVPCSNIAYHSRYIAEAGSTLLKYLKQVIPHPTKRSPKWISSSVPEDKWSLESAQYSSAEYHTNNLLNAVLFEEASKHIPANAITIEIAPHGLLQAILRRSLKSDVTNVALTQRGHKDNTEVLLGGLGKLFQAGLNLNIAKLYPNVEFPVSRGTPMLSPLIKWEHTEDWFVTSYRMQEKIKSGERTVTVCLADEEQEYLSGHVVDGRNLYPATAYLTLIWETIGMMRGEFYRSIPIVFENVRFLRATHIPQEGNLEFVVMVQKGTGNFEIMESGAAVVTGRAFVPTDAAKEQIYLEKPEADTDTLPLTSKDIYKELRLRGYNYSGSFRGLVKCDNKLTSGEILCNTNWVCFLDNMMQMMILKEDTRSLYVPTQILRLSIDTKSHESIITELGEEKSIPVYTYEDVGIIKSGGVEIRGMKANVISRKKPLGEPVLEKYRFVSHYSTEQRLAAEAIRINIQLALENVPGYKLKVLELIDNATTELLSKDIALTLGDLPLIHGEITVLTPPDVDIPDPGFGIAVDSRKLQSESNCYLIVGQDLLKNSPVLEDALKALKENGFILSRENLSGNINVPANLQILSSQVVNNERLVLLRKKSELKKINLIYLRDDDVQLSWLKEVQKAMKSGNRILLCSQSNPKSGILGLVNCIRKEPGGEIVQCVFILDKKAPKFNIEDKFYKMQLDLNLAFNVLQDGQWGTFRHLQLSNDSLVFSEHCYVNALTRGDLSSLRWIQGPLSSSTKVNPDKELVQIHCSALNFRDIMLTTNKLAVEAVADGRLEQENVIGFEFSGFTKSGRRVMGFTTYGAIATMTTIDKYFLWDVPDHWSLRDAATVPVAYGTAYYALIMVGELQRGMEVLIHVGSGGVGQAAIHLALHYGCTVYTTVGTEEKRNFIKRTFPQIKDWQIGNSRDSSFEQLVLNGTNGRGVDIVLNSLAEEKLQASVRCLASNGRFLEIGKFDIANNNQLGMGTFLKETSFHGVMLDKFMKAPTSDKKKLFEIMTEGIRSGCVRPLPSTVFQHDEVEQAFRYMAAGKHIGKVLIEIRSEEKNVKTVIPAIPRFYCQSNMTYIICGGLGGFGLELADWLVLRGARKLVLTSRKGLTTGYQGLRLRIWKGYGCVVKITSIDCSTQKGCEQLLQEANAIGPVAAIFNLAVQLSDALFENQTETNFKESFSPKATATAYLDVASRKLCPALQHFVVFSSVSCGRGNAGQSNYGMSNSVMERICEARVADGLPALAVQWGAIGEVGLVAEMQESDIDIEIGGTLQQRIGSCLEALDGFLNQKEPIVASMVVAEKRVGSGSQDGIVETVAKLLGIRDLKTISLQTTLAELGMDSMMAVEIKQGLEREYEIFLTAQEVRNLTFERLHELAELQQTAQASSELNTNEMMAHGLQFLFRVIGDELKSSQAILRLPSLADDGNIIENTSPAVYLIPGIEGIASVLEPFASKLKLQALCLQLGYEQPGKSVEEMAKQLIPHLKSRISISDSFNIVAYSYGSTIALEVARILEKEGRRGRLCFIDGAPDFLKAIVNYQMNVSNEHSLEVDLLCSIIGLLGLTDREYFKEGVNLIPAWSEKVKLFLAYAPSNSQFSKEYLKAMCNATYTRVKALLSYDTSNLKPIQSPITLIRASEAAISNMEEDYGLSKLSSGKVTVTYVEGNHATILDNKKSADIVNKLSFEGEDAMAFKSKIMTGAAALVNENISHTKRL